MKSLIFLFRSAIVLKSKVTCLLEHVLNKETKEAGLCEKLGHQVSSENYHKVQSLGMVARICNPKTQRAKKQENQSQCGVCVCVGDLEPCAMSLWSCVESRDKAEPNTCHLLLIGSCPVTFHPLCRIQSKPRNIWRAVFPSTWQSSGFANKVSDKTWSDLEDMEAND